MGSIGVYGIELSSSTEFCLLCHEMRIVGEQGWMHSRHYHNDGGIVAQCKDCHIPPELMPKLWVKTRDGIKDVYAHFLGESDPMKMDWEHLAISARRKTYDSACRKCHINLTPRGADIKMIMAHRRYLILQKKKRCLDCHTQEFHGDFKEYLFDTKEAHSQGGTP